MRSIRYIGKKPVMKGAFAGADTVWNGPGDVQAVPDALVSKFLQHTDSFELVDDAPPVNKGRRDEERPPEPPADEGRRDEAPLVALEAMDAQALRDYALQHFGETFHPRTGEEKMRQAIVGMMNRG